MYALGLLLRRAIDRSARLEHEMRYVSMWEFEVRAERVADFLAHYGPSGSWAALFRRAPGYLGTYLLIDRANANRFVTIDQWQTEAHFLTFKERFSSEYASLDRACEGLTTHEANLGSYHAHV